MRLYLAPFLFLVTTGIASGEPSYVQSAGGEMVSELALDLSTLPPFAWVADPFLKIPGKRRAPASATAEDIEYSLQATTIEGEEAVAVVNDRVVRVGDQVGRRTVLKIGHSFVLLGDRGSVIEATLEEGESSPIGQKREPASISSKANEPEGQIKIEELKK